MDMRDWLIIIVIVGIVVILADGYRRKYKNSIRIKIDKNIPPQDAFDDDPMETLELPNGGARIKHRHNLAGQIESDYPEEDDRYEEDEPLEGNVPVLMDALEISSKNKTTGSQKQGAESVAGSDLVVEDDLEDAEDWDDEYDGDYKEHENDEDFLVDTGAEKEKNFEAFVTSDSIKDLNTSQDDKDVFAEEGESDIDEGEGEGEGSLSSVKVNRWDSPIAERSNGRIEPSLGELDPLSTDELDDKPQHLRKVDNPISKPKTKDKTKYKARPAHKDSPQTELFSESPEDYFQDETQDDDKYLEPESVIVINVMAKRGEYFAGKALLPILLQQGMQLGKMSIFHKHADTEGNGPTMFSMANMVKPGTFDVSQMDEFTTAGVSFFLQLPNQLGNMRCFEEMLMAANSIKQSLNGELKDENRSVITRQTIEHCRQRIQDFELAQLSQK
jgi:cell division protein ZipA